MDNLRNYIRHLMREALVLKKNTEAGKLMAVSDLPDAKAASSETFKNKEALKKDDLFRWENGYWTTDVSNFTNALSRLNAINKKEAFINKLEDVEEMIASSDAPNKANLGDRIKLFIDDLANATDEKAADAKIKQYLNFFAKFKGHSFTNTILIWLQRPDASRVAGFRQWEEKYHRRVNKGAKGIMIFAPLISKGGKNDEVQVDNASDEKRIYGFKAVYVFDISDTTAIDERGEIPQVPDWFDNNTPSETADQLTNYIIELSQELGIQVTRDDSKSGEKGYSAGNHINLSSDVAGVGQFSVAVHELAHELMHRKESSLYYSLEGTTGNPKHLKELQAEAVSYTVCKHYNLPVQHQATYLAMWKANRDKIQENLNIISKVSRFIIERIDAIAERNQSPQPTNNSQVAPQQ